MNTTRKGKIGESEVINEALRRGYNLSIPFQEGVPYDLILDDGENLERVQIKYTESDGEVIQVHLTSDNNWQSKSYEGEVEYILCYDATTDEIVKINDLDGNKKKIRIAPTKNNQEKGINWIEDYRW